MATFWTCSCKYFWNSGTQLWQAIGCSAQNAVMGKQGLSLLTRGETTHKYFVMFIFIDGWSITLFCLCSLQFDPAPRRGEPHVTRRTPDYFLWWKITSRPCKPFMACCPFLGSKWIHIWGCFPGELIALVAIFFKEIHIIVFQVMLICFKHDLSRCNLIITCKCHGGLF